MTDAEKIETIEKLVNIRANMAEHTIETASAFMRYTTEKSGYRELYTTKLNAATAVSSFCYELLDILHAMYLED